MKVIRELISMFFPSTGKEEKQNETDFQKVSERLKSELEQLNEVELELQQKIEELKSTS